MLNFRFTIFKPTYLNLIKINVVFLFLISNVLLLFVVDTIYDLTKTCA